MVDREERKGEVTPFWRTYTHTDTCKGGRVDDFQTCKFFQLYFIEFFSISYNTSQ